MLPLPFKPQLHVIHLPHRVDRQERYEKEFAEQGINFRIWDGLIVKGKPKEGINLSHKKIVKWAKENKLPYVLIAEDDIAFTHPKSWEYFLSKLPAPDQYDLFFSMIYQAEVQDGRILNGMSGMTMYAVSAKFYDFFLSIPDKVDIDRWLGQFAFEKQYLIIDKYVCFQTGGYTDHQKKVLYYDVYLEGKEMFQG